MALKGCDVDKRIPKLRDLTKPCSLYRITNVVNGKMYIGISTNVKNRFKNHRRKNGDSLVNRAINKYGVDSFKFDVLVVSTVENCLEMESAAIVAFNTLVPNGYNICKEAGAPEPLKGFFSPNSKLKESHLPLFLDKALSSRDISNMLGVTQRVVVLARSGNSYSGFFKLDGYYEAVENLNTSRRRAGENHGMTKLTKEQAMEIYLSELPTKVLAGRYGVRYLVIQRIRSGASWKCLHEKEEK